MQRRQFIKIMGLGVATTALSSSLVACSSGEVELDYGWGTKSLEHDDIRLTLIAHAMLCPNPHNIQPWLIKMTAENSFDLYVDQTRLLPETDPIARQIHIGHGTFLETLSIAASGFGYEADISYFPQGEYSNQVTLDKPVASIELKKQNKGMVDPLFSQLLKRQSNKREYDNSVLTQVEKSQLSHFYNAEIVGHLRFIEQKKDTKYLQKVLTDAMAIEVRNKQRDLETVSMFRFNDEEVAKYRDGFGLAHSGVTGFKKMMAETFFLSRESTEKDPTEFGQQSIQVTDRVSLSTSSFALLTSVGNSRLDQVKVGREYCRLNLTTSAMGLAQHPMSQVLQEYPDMQMLQNQFKKHFNIKQDHTVQMLVRLGRAQKTEHTPRRLVGNIIKT